MTESDFAKLKFRCVAHLNMEHEHTMTYESVDYMPTIGMCIHTPAKKDGTWGEPYTHYAFNGNVYESKESFLEAATAFEEERKSKFEKK